MDNAWIIKRTAALLAGTMVIRALLAWLSYVEDDQEV